MVLSLFILIINELLNARGTPINSELIHDIILENVISIILLN